MVAFIRRCPPHRTSFINILMEGPGRINGQMKRDIARGYKRRGIEVDSYRRRYPGQSLNLNLFVDIKQPR